MSLIMIMVCNNHGVSFDRNADTHTVKTHSATLNTRRSLEVAPDIGKGIVFSGRRASAGCGIATSARHVSPDVACVAR